MAEDETDEAEPRVREGLEGDPVDEDDLGPEVPSHPDASTLESWWRAYLGLPEPRSPKRLARIVHANVHRVRRAVRTGWPDIGIASFESRLGDAEDQVARARAKAQIDGVVRGAGNIVGAAFAPGTGQRRDSSDDSAPQWNSRGLAKR